MILIMVSHVFGSIPMCNKAKPSEMVCKPLNDVDCQLDQLITINCTVFHSTICTGDRNFQIENVNCRYCFQIEESLVECDPLVDCTPKIGVFTTKCRSIVHCIGPSIFEKRAQCLRSEKSQKTAFLLSLFLGGVAADRFYLGHYVSAAFKLITFGGLGIAYMIDLFLILFGYLGPADGSLFPERI